MKIKEGFVVREVAGNTIAVATGEAAKTFNGMITINETGKMLFERLSRGATEQELVDVLMENFDVSEQIAAADVKSFVARLEGSGVLE